MSNRLDTFEEHNVLITENKLEADLCIPKNAGAIVLIIHGSGSGRQSLRNQYLAKKLNDAGLATLLVDLITLEEREVDRDKHHLRYDINLLLKRLLDVIDWLTQNPQTNLLNIGYFGTSTGAAVALMCAAQPNNSVKTIVCRAGRPDLVMPEVLRRVGVPVLLIVGGNDAPVTALNRNALHDMPHARIRELAIVPGAGHLFEEEGKMEEAANLAVDWFGCYLLMNGTKFENRYKPRASWLPSVFKEKPNLHMKFKDRTAAGDILSSLLGKYVDRRNTTVIAIPRGGVIVGDRVARKLSTHFDIVIPRKLRRPNHSEDAIGALMHDGSIYLDNNIMRSLDISDKYLETEKLEQEKEIERRLRLYRPSQKEYDIKDRIVLLIDDGAATGATIIAAARWIREYEPQLLVIALPVAPENVIDVLRHEADHVEVINVVKASKFKTVGYYYTEYLSVPDDVVVKIVESLKHQIL